MTDTQWTPPGMTGAELTAYRDTSWPHQKLLSAYIERTLRPRPMAEAPRDGAWILGYLGDNPSPVNVVYIGGRWTDTAGGRHAEATFSGWIPDVRQEVKS